jgi:hypothetical protein
MSGLGAVSVGNTVGRGSLVSGCPGNLFVRNFFGRITQTGIFSKQKSGSGNISGQKTHAGRKNRNVNLPACLCE